MPGRQVENTARHKHRGVVDQNIDAAISIQGAFGCGFDLGFITVMSAFTAMASPSGLDHLLSDEWCQVARIRLDL